MRRHSLDEVYRGIHPALGNLGILYWNSIAEKAPATPLFLYGDSISCELFRQRFENNNIPVAGIILHECRTRESVVKQNGFKAIKALPDSAIVIVTFREYPRNIELYYAVNKQLQKYGVVTPYVIHEFCSGFALNAEKLISERDRVVHAFSLLLDLSSRECFYEYIKNSATPYRWNMDITNELFGMNDYETNRFMETRWSTHNQETITAFVQSIRQSQDSYLFAIIENKSCKHIGNIKIGPINKRYGYADISYFIGDPDFRGLGLAKDAVEVICKFGFSELMLHRIQAGVIVGNPASEEVLLSCGFQLEGRLRDKFVVEGHYADHLLYGLISKTRN